ncbi:MAG: DNA mismatch repair protein MutS [Spirochaetaceae bacterium]|nr:DNA mismatch repair protein MutS [Spirochaetaceae bacterium]
MFRQYAEHKEKHKDAVLFFRMGDFYEMFRSDAVEVSRLMNLTLTQRQGIPMCGIPYHAAGNYIARLLKLGKKIAICEQIELPPGGKGLAKRDVVEVVTPGTVVDDSYLEERTNNYLAALAGNPRSPAFAYIDLSTGEFRTTLLSGGYPKEALRRELARTAPREIIVQESLLESNEFSFLADEDVVLDRMPDWSFDTAASVERLNRQFGTVNLKAFGLTESDPRIPVAGAVLDYLEDKHKGLLPHVKEIDTYGEADSVGLDESTIRNLEIVRNLQDGGRSFTLLDTLDHTKTAPGARLFRQKLLNPLPDCASIVAYHGRVETLYRNQHVLSSLREVLSGVLDLERLSARTAMDRAHAKDLLAIRDSLTRAARLRDLVDDDVLGVPTEHLDSLFQPLSRLGEYLGESLMEDPSILLTEGRLIREGWDESLDRMRSVRDDGKSLLNSYVAEEKAATGIQSLKLKHNRILGHFLEVGKNQAEKMPERFRRRQSLTQAERYSTPKLDELETEITSVGEKIVDRERELFLTIRDEVKKHVSALLELAAIIADIDVVQSFSHAATEYGYVRPEMNEGTVCNITGGRHPVVERHMPHGSFVPNNISLAGDGISFAMVTGPNMAGKSTVLRQVALITLMAQSGSFVPADSAQIGVVDRIFCRVGASDNLARGESTFLVEMNETANILRNATSNSLVIMDEVGRGTGTADGLAIAQAVCEYLLSHEAPRTLFATHYRELTRLQHPKLANYSMSVQETGETIVFPKILIPGPAQASYGIHVAALAGLPEEVVTRARILLSAGDDDRFEPKEEMVKSSSRTEDLFLFEPADLIIDRLRSLNTDDLTPLEALKLLAEWRDELRLKD